METTSTLATLNAINVSLQNITVALRIQPFWNTQWFAAIIGAAIGLTPSFYLLYKDRPIIKLKKWHSFVSLGNRIQNGFSVEIGNSGRRPITVASFYLKFRDGKSMVFVDPTLFVGGSGLPKVLNEGNSHSVTLLADALESDIHKKDYYPVAACYEDALGQVYKCRLSRKFWDTLFKVNASDPASPTRNSDEDPLS